MSPELQRLKGAINRWMGISTGDREQEARGTVQQRTGHDPSIPEQQRSVHDVKQQHHDYGIKSGRREPRKP